jgi:murein DD-endopeptidase MepM/ murein hydrolase activator NlpD
VVDGHHRHHHGWELSHALDDTETDLWHKGVPGVAVPTFFLAPILLFLTGGGTASPWPARCPPIRPVGAHELTSPDRWPAEPTSPAPIDPTRFNDALSYVCGRPADEVPGTLILAAAVDAGVDPFLLAALVRDRSHCDTKRKARDGYGLLTIQPDMYLTTGAPRLPFDPRALAAKALLEPEHNLRVGARLLRMWQDNHATLDESFGGVPHRSGVAHFLWGDRVANSGGEDAVFTGRRRIIDRYLGLPDAPNETSIGVPILCPLEGNPRVASSGPGDDRDGGVRRHRGLDIAATEGEPIRAVADGTVIFAGANLRGSPRKVIPPSQIARFRNRRFGAGGIYICIRHDLPEDLPNRPRNVVSCYMHLSSYRVSTGQRVTAGQTIAFVGHTGVRQSPVHLHFELRVNDQPKDPSRYLSETVIPPKATKTYYHVQAVHRARVRASRALLRRSKS